MAFDPSKPYSVVPSKKQFDPSRSFSVVNQDEDEASDEVIVLDAQPDVEQIEQQAPAETIVVAPPVSQDDTTEDDGFSLTDIPKSLAAGAAKDVMESTSGFMTAKADAGVGFKPSEQYRQRAMTIGMGGMGVGPYQVPASLREEDKKFTPEVMRGIQKETARMTERIRDEADALADNMGISKEFQQSLPGQVTQGLGGMIAQIPTMGLGYVGNAYSQGVRRSEEAYGKRFSDFTKEERDSVRIANLSGAAGGFVLNRIGMKYAGSTDISKFLTGKLKLDGNALGRMFKAFVAEGTEETGEAIMFESLATAFYDRGNEIFSAENVSEYINNFLVGGMVGGTFRGGVEVTGKVLGVNPDGSPSDNGDSVSMENIAQASPEMLNSIITRPRIRVKFIRESDDDNLSPESEEAVIFAETNEEAQGILNEYAEKEGFVISKNPVLFETIVAPETAQANEADPSQEYQPEPLPSDVDLDADLRVALDNIVQEKVDLYGEDSLDKLVQETTAIQGSDAGAYVLREGQRYVRYKAAQVDPETGERSQEAIDLDNAKARKAQAEGTKKKLGEFRSGRKLLKFQERKQKLEDEYEQLQEDLAQSPLKVDSGEQTLDEARAERKRIRQEISNKENLLVIANAEISKIEPSVRSELAKRRKKNEKPKGALGKAFDVAMKPLTELLENVGGRTKGLFRNFERITGDRILKYQDRLKSGYNTLSKLEKKNVKEYRELVRLLSLDPDDPATQESQDQEQAEGQVNEQGQQAIPIEDFGGVPFIPSNRGPGRSSSEADATILDEFGNPVQEGTRLPISDPRPNPSPQPIPGIKGAIPPKKLQFGNIKVGRVAVKFESWVDRSLYLVRQGTTAASAPEHMNWLMNTLGISRKDVQELSKEVVIRTKAAGKIALKNGDESIRMNASLRLVEAAKSDDYLANLSETARNSFNFVRTQFPNVDIIVGGTLAETRANIVQSLKGKLGLAKATDVANNFTDMDNGQAVFVGDKPVAIIINDAMANSNTVAHETWELILNEAFRGDVKRMKELQKSIDSQLRKSGFTALANRLKKFSDMYDGDIRYSEYLAEFGATLVEGGFDPKNLTQKQKGFLAEVKKILNGFARVLAGKPMFLADANADNVMAMFVNVAHKVSTGADVDLVQLGQQELDLNDDIRTTSQIDDRLTMPGIKGLKTSEIVPKTGGKNPRKTLARARALIEQYPNALTDRGQWVELMSRMTGTRIENKETGEVRVPRFPEGLGELTTTEGVLEALKIVSPEQRRLATEGLKGGIEIRAMYDKGLMTPNESAEYFLWNILSIGISPYPQESAFLTSLTNGVQVFIDKAVKGQFLSGKMVEIMVPKKEEGKKVKDQNGEVVMEAAEMDSGIVEYLNWVDAALPIGLPGSGAKSNLNSFGKNFLAKAGQRVVGGDFDGMTRMEALHELLADKDTPTLELRQKWQEFATGMSFNNKIFDFILLTTGRQDLYVIDRVRVEDFWDAPVLREELGLKEGTSIYDGAELVRGKTKSAGYSKILDNISGMVINEVAVRQTRTAVQEAYKQLGVTESADVGRFHWETWVAKSGQEVSHGSIDAIQQIKKYGDVQRAAVREGKYGKWDFNMSYIKEKGKPFMFEFTDNDGNVYVFDNLSKVQDEIEAQNSSAKHNKDNRFILKDKNGKIIKRKTNKTKGITLTKAWYDYDGVDTQEYFRFLESEAIEVRPSSTIIDDQGIVVKRQRSYEKPLPGVTRINKDPDAILNISEDDRTEFRQTDPNTGLPRLARKRNYALKPDALQLKELSKDLVKDPENKELRKRVEAKRESYRRKAGLVPSASDVVMPITVFSEVPSIPSSKELTYALSKNKVKGGYNPIIGVNLQIEDDVPVSLRLDIPAYDKYGTYIVSIHDGTEESGSTLGYAPFARINNVQFYSVPDAAINIAAGKSKSTIARMHGSFVNDNRENILQDAEALMASGEWAQVGMNPQRASYFYNKSTGKPVISADEVIQIGALVLAKNAVEVNPDNPRAYQRFNPNSQVRVRYQKKSPTIDPKKRAELIARRDELLRKNGLYDWFHTDVRTVLNKLYDEAEALGLPLEYLRDYFPRSIKDYEGLKQSLNISDSQADTIIGTINAERSKKNQAPLDSNQQGIALENYVRRNMNALPAGAKTPGNIKARDVDLISDDMLDNYTDPVQALSTYILDMVTAIETRKLIGSQSVDGERISGTLGRELNRMRQSGELTDGDLKQVQDIVSKVFSRKKAEAAVLENARLLTYNTLLQDISSTLTQLKDTALSIHRFGMVGTIRAFSDDQIALEDIGKAGKRITSEIEAAPEKFLAKSLNAIHTVTGFKRLDGKMKTVALNASYRQMQRAAKSNPNSSAYKNLVSKLKFIQGDQHVMTIAGLKAGTKNDYIMEALYNDLADVQPIGRFEMPLVYNAHPNARILYSLKSFAIVQFSYFRRNTINQMFGKNKSLKERTEGFANLLSLMASLLIVGVPVDAIKDWLLGRPFFLADSAVDNMLMVTMGNRYLANSFREKGAVLTSLGFAAPAVTSVYSGVERTIKSGDPWGLTRYLLFKDLYFYRATKTGKDIVREKRQDKAKKGVYEIPLPGKRLNTVGLKDPFSPKDEVNPLVDPRLLGY